MKTISSALAAHLESQTTTLATCWKVTLTNGTVKTFTDHDVDLVVASLTYSSMAGYTPSAIQTSSALNVDNLEIQGFLSSPAITDADLNAGLWDYAMVEVFQVNWADLTMGTMALRKGTIGEVTSGRHVFHSELRGLTQAYSRNFGQIYSPGCRADVGDSRCTVELGSFTVTGTVDSASSDNRIIYDAARAEAGPTGSVAITGISRALAAVVTCTAHGFVTGAAILISAVAGVVQAGSGDSLNGKIYSITVINANSFSINVDTRLYNADPLIGQPNADLVYSAYTSGGLAYPTDSSGYFTYGKITFTSGLNNNLSMEVSAYVPGVITLAMPMPYLVDVGDTYSMYAGCNKSFAACKDKFNNVVNFRGEPHLPGLDKILQVGGRSS